MFTPRAYRLIATFAISWPFLCSAADPQPKTEELKRLDRFAGKWEGTIESVGQTSNSEISWILGGTVLQQKYQYSDGSTGLILRGYEKESGRYFFTLMDSRGIVVILTNGSWNEATKTFKFDGYQASNNVTLRSVFQDDDTENWTFTFTKPGGQVTELRGTNKRKK